MCVCVGGGAINKTAMSYRRNSVWVAHHPHGSFFMQQHMGHEEYKPHPYRWFSWGVASLPEGKSRCLGLVQLRAKYRLVSATSSPYH